MDDIKYFIKTVLGFKNSENIQLFADSCCVRKYRAGDIVYHQGDEIKEIVFLKEGVYRAFLVNEDGEEITTCIGASYGYAAVPYSFMDGPSTESLQVLCDSSFICMKLANVREKLINDEECLHAYNDLLKEAVAFTKAVNEACAGTSAQQRFDWFEENFPGVADMMTNEQLASFLCIAPVTLSRIKNS